MTTSRQREFGAPTAEPLPVPLAPIPGETATGFAHRLASANEMPFADLRLHVRDLAGLSSNRPDLELGHRVIEHLGGIRRGHFAAQARRHEMPVRCSHNDWKIDYCTRGCGSPQPPRTACLRCSHGQSTTVISRGGAVCLHHGRWHLDGRDIDIRRFPEYGRAERWLSGKLWLRGIGLHTGELQLAARLLRIAAEDTRSSPAIGRGQTLGVDPFSSDADFLLCAYPEIVALTGTLIQPEFLRYLLSPRYDPRPQVEIIEGVIARLAHAPAERGLRRTAENVIEHSRRAVLAAYGARKSRNVKTIRCRLDKALYASARTHRACLLRHLDAVRIPANWDVPLGWAAPPTRVLNRARLLPDDLDAILEHAGIGSELDLRAGTVSRARRLLVLNVDGTIARIRSGQEPDADHWRSWLDIDTGLIRELDRIVHRTGVHVAWLTSWPRDQLEWFIQHPLGGRLGGEHIPWQDWPKPGWRMRSLISYAVGTHAEAVVWVDGRAPYDAEARFVDGTGQRMRLVRTDKDVGLTGAVVERIERLLSPSRVPRAAHAEQVRFA